jgi:hypothetical protein
MACFLTTLFVIVEPVVVMASPAIAVSQTPLNLEKVSFQVRNQGGTQAKTLYSSDLAFVSFSSSVLVLAN